MKHFRARRPLLAPIGVLLVLMTTLSTPSLAGGVTQTENRVPKKLWKTYPFDPSGGTARIERGSASHEKNGALDQPRRATTTSVAEDNSAHFGQQHGSSGGARFQTVAYLAGAVVLLLMLILLMRPAVRAVRGLEGAFPAGTVILFVSVVFVSVVVGIGVVLFISPLLGP
jgi:hypothetical protein